MLEGRLFTLVFLSFRLHFFGAVIRFCFLTTTSILNTAPNTTPTVFVPFRYSDITGVRCGAPGPVDAYGPLPAPTTTNQAYHVLTANAFLLRSSRNRWPRAGTDRRRLGAWGYQPCEQWTGSWDYGLFWRFGERIGGNEEHKTLQTESHLSPPRTRTKGLAGHVVRLLPCDADMDNYFEGFGDTTSSQVFCSLACGALFGSELLSLFLQVGERRSMFSRCRKTAL